MKKVLLSLVAVVLSLHFVSASAHAANWKEVKEFTTQSAIKDESRKCQYRLRYNFVDTFYNHPQTVYYYATEAHSSPLGIGLKFPINPSELVLPERFSQPLGAAAQQRIKANFFENAPYGIRTAYLAIFSSRFPKLNLVVEGFLRSGNQLTSSGESINNAFFTLEKRC